MWGVFVGRHGRACGCRTTVLLLACRTHLEQHHLAHPPLLTYQQHNQGHHTHSHLRVSCRTTMPQVDTLQQKLKRTERALAEAAAGGAGAAAGPSGKAGAASGARAGGAALVGGKENRR